MQQIDSLQIDPLFFAKSGETFLVLLKETFLFLKGIWKIANCPPPYFFQKIAKRRGGQFTLNLYELMLIYYLSQPYCHKKIWWTFLKNLRLKVHVPPLSFELSIFEKNDSKIFTLVNRVVNYVKQFLSMHEFLEST